MHLLGTQKSSRGEVLKEAPNAIRLTPETKNLSVELDMAIFGQGGPSLQVTFDEL